MALSLRGHHADTLIVPMSLIWDAYQAEILGGLADAGEDVLHVLLETDVRVLWEQLEARAPVAANPETSEPAREWTMSRVEAAVAGSAAGSLTRGPVRHVRAGYRTQP